MNFRTLADIEPALRRLLPAVPRDVDVVVGIPRSGMLVACPLALYLNKPVTDLEGFLDGRLIRSGRRPVLMPGGAAAEAEPAADDAAYLSACRRALIVDDCVGNGTQLRAVQARLGDIQARGGLPCPVTYAAAFTTPDGAELLDLHGEVVGWPQCFQWNIMQHPDYLSRSCLDMDGVLCVNPTRDQDDDGPRYDAFLEQASPLFTPTVELGAIVTSRPEFKRPQTQAWLERHGIRCRELLMLPGERFLPRAQRHEAGIRHKVDAYRRLDSLLFIESDLPIAVEIANRSGRPVLAVDAQELVMPGRTARAVLARRTPRQLLRAARRRVRRARQAVTR